MAADGACRDLAWELPGELDLPLLGPPAALQAPLAVSGQRLDLPEGPCAGPALEEMPGRCSCEDCSCLGLTGRASSSPEPNSTTFVAAAMLAAPTDCLAALRVTLCGLPPESTACAGVSTAASAEGLLRLEVNLSRVACFLVPAAPAVLLLLADPCRHSSACNGGSLTALPLQGSWMLTT